MSSGNKRSIYLLVILLAAVVAIVAVLLVGLGGAPGPEPELAKPEELAISSEEGPTASASRPAAAPRRSAEARPGVAAPVAPARRPSVTPPPRRSLGSTRLPGQAAPAAPTLDTPAVSAALQAIKPAVDKCYEEGKKRDPQLAGTATLRFTVVVSGGRGQIQNSALRSSDFRDPALENCLLGAFTGQRFDAPGPDGRRTLDFPIMLGPVGKRPPS